MAYKTLNFYVNNVLADATSVVLGSADGTYGIKNLDNGTVVVPNNTAVIHYNTGVYRYDVSALSPNVKYQISWQIVYNGTTQYATATFTIGSTTQLLSDVKTYLRIDSSDTSFDVEVQDLINAAQTDLIEVGINPDIFNSGDPLIKKAITTYCKANFGYDTDNSDKFHESYEKMKIFLMNNVDYQPLIVAVSSQ